MWKSYASDLIPERIFYVYVYFNHAHVYSFIFFTVNHIISLLQILLNTYIFDLPSSISFYLCFSHLWLAIWSLYTYFFGDFCESRLCYIHAIIFIYTSIYLFIFFFKTHSAHSLYNKMCINMAMIILLFFFFFFLE